MRLISITFLVLKLALNHSLANDMLKAADASKGFELMSICLTCHSIVKNEPSKGSDPSRHYVGPNLFGVYGRKIASKKDFKYSPALAKRKNEVWDADTLSSFLKSPARFAPGGMMNFSGLLDPQDRMDVIAYLMTLK